MARLIPDSGTAELEEYEIADIVPDSAVLRSDPGAFLMAVEDVAEWLRFHYDNIQIEVIHLACEAVEGVSGNDD